MDANAGVFEAVLNEQDVMIADRLVHASIVDGMRLCKAMRDTYKHSNMEHLEEKLQEHQDKRARLIITDGVFSMDGDLAKLDEIVALAEKYDAMVFVDDSPRLGFHRQDRPRHPRALRRAGADRHRHHHPGQGPGRRLGRLRERPQGAGRAVPAEGAALPVLQHGGPGHRVGRHQGAGPGHRPPPSGGTSWSGTPSSGARVWRRSAWTSRPATAPSCR